VSFINGNMSWLMPDADLRDLRDRLEAVQDLTYQGAGPGDNPTSVQWDKESGVLTITWD